MRSKAYRWECPLCRAGINAPSRLNKDDVRRYCLPCSAERDRSPQAKHQFGRFRLVERIAPALERKRRIRAARRTGKGDLNALDDKFMPTWGDVIAYAER